MISVFSSRRLLLGAGVAAVILVVFSIIWAAGLGVLPALLSTAIVSGLVASLASRPVEGGAVAAAIVEPTPSRLTDEEFSRLRHDLRGILSPALMTADRVLMSSQDPLARRAAETMIATVERAEKRLSAPRL